MLLGECSHRATTGMPLGSVGQLHRVLVRLVWLVGRILRDRWTRDCCTQPCEDDELVLMRRWYCCRSHAETITPLQPAK